MNPKSGLLSVIFLSYQSELRLEKNAALLMNALKEEEISFELIIMDDGSTDRSPEIGLELESKYSEVSTYQLSKNYTSPYSVFAGMKVSKGDCVVPFSDDLQRPIEVVIRMYRLWQKGAKVVIAHHEKRSDGLLSDLFSNAYYGVMNRYSGVSFAQGGGNGLLADREIINIINREISPRNTSPTIEILKLGFQPVYLPFNRPSVNSKSRWTWKKKIKLASDNFFSTSYFPLKVISYLGWYTFLISLVAIFAIIIIKIFGNNTLFGFPIHGWTTIIILVTLFNGLILLCLGVVSEYIWRIFEEVKHRPGYIIKEKSDGKDDET